MAKPAVATDIRDVQVIKHGRAFFLSDRLGDLPADNRAALGLYFRDTRFLSRLELDLNDLSPVLLHSSTERNYSQTVELAYPVTTLDPQGFERREHVSVSRNRLLAESLIEQITVSNFGAERWPVRLALLFEADFLDLFEVRGFTRSQPGQPLPPEVDQHSVTLGYRGVDGVVRTTGLRFSPAPTELTPGEAVFEFQLDHGGKAGVTVEVTARAGDRTPPRKTYREAREGLEREYTGWRKRCTRFRTGHHQLQGFLNRAVLDLRMLLSEDDDGAPYIDAGIPWFSALFGRDSLITAYECLGVNRTWRGACSAAWRRCRAPTRTSGGRRSPARSCTRSGWGSWPPSARSRTRRTTARSTRRRCGWSCSRTHTAGRATWRASGRCGRTRCGRWSGSTGSATPTATATSSTGSGRGVAWTTRGGRTRGTR